MKGRVIGINSGTYRAALRIYGDDSPSYNNPIALRHSYLQSPGTLPEHYKHAPAYMLVTEYYHGTRKHHVPA